MLLTKSINFRLGLSVMPYQPAQNDISSTTVRVANKPQLEFIQCYRAFILIRMEDLMKVIKEANSELETLIGDKDKLMDEIANDEVKLKDYIEKCNELATKYHERVKDQVTLEYFAQLMILDMQYNFMGGGALNPNGDTVIQVG